jgi:hypothetical protein
MSSREGEKTYTIYYDAAEGFVRMEWYGYATQAECREGTEYMLKVLVENRANKVLADIKEMTLIGKDDQSYIQYNFLPRAIERGFRAIALVRPVNYFNAIAVDSILPRAEALRIQMRVFDDLGEAKEWLRSLEV